MCDSVTSTVISSSNSNALQSCWIVYTNSQGKEGLTVTKCPSTPMDGVNSINSSITISNSSTGMSGGHVGGSFPLDAVVGKVVPDSTATADDGGGGGGGGADDRGNNKQNEVALGDTLYSILDQNLRPLTPVPNNPLSEQIHNEHKLLVQKYFEFETQIVTSMAQREMLQNNMLPEELQLKKAYIKRLEEREALLKFKANLQKQLNEKNRQQQTRQQQHMLQPPPLNRQESDSEWVIIPPSECRPKTDNHH